VHPGENQGKNATALSWVKQPLSGWSRQITQSTVKITRQWTQAKPAFIPAKGIACIQQHG
jgi:hypothetical protein